MIRRHRLWSAAFVLLFTSPAIGLGLSERQLNSALNQSVEAENPLTNVRGLGGEVHGDKFGVTGPGDTLWAIALKVRPDDQVSVQQVMLALQRANPDAFVNDNINLLKAGHVLRIPDLDEVRDISLNSAVRQVRNQKEAFDDYRSGSGFAQMDVTAWSAAPSSRSDAEDDGELRLLAEAGSLWADSGAGGERDALQNEPEVTKEDLDRARRANTELNLKLEDIRAQNKTLNEIVKQNEDRLALLQAQVAKLQQVVQAGGVGSPPAAPPPPAQPAPRGSLMSNPLVLSGGTLLVVALAAAGLFVVRRRREEAAQDEPLTQAEIAAPENDEFDAERESELALDESAAADEEDVSHQTSDAISEAEIYIAYGRFPQAITSLRNAIEAEPARTDLQLKLMEVFTQTQDATAFNLLFEGFSDIASEVEIEEARGLRVRIPGTAKAAMDATVISTEPIAELEDADAGEVDMSFDLDRDLDATVDLLSGDYDLELDDIELTDTDVTATVEAEAVGLELGDDDDLDFDLDLGSDDSLDLDDDGLDLDLENDGALEHDLDDDANNKLDLARAYIDMGDSDGARNVLQEIMKEGSETEAREASELLGQID